MSRVIYDHLTLEQFLELPEAKPPLEYVRGRVVATMSPLLPHARIEQLLWLWLYQHTLKHGLGDCFVELRCTFGGESVVPDIVYLQAGRIPFESRGEYAETGVFDAPDLMIEILSPGQTVKAMAGRLARLVKKGVRLAWLIQPSTKRVSVFRPGAPVELLELGSSLDGETVLPGFRLPLSELFDWLRVGSRPFPTPL
jgi:Uma2 family endonuclease